MALKVVVDCAQCGDAFLVARNEVARGAGRYCSHACAGAAMKRPPNAACTACGKSVHIKLSAMPAHPTCSKACAIIARRKPCAEVQCAHCGELFRQPNATPSQQREFCSHACANRATAAKRDGHELLRCRKCGAQFKAYKSEGRQFCSHPCATSAPQWLAARSNTAVKTIASKKPHVPYGSHLFRSKWERDFAAWLDVLGASWAYEPRRFTLSDGRAYTPDFRVGTPFGECFVELHRIDPPKPGDSKIAKLALAGRELPALDGGAPFVVLGESDVAAFRSAMRRATVAHG